MPVAKLFQRAIRVQLCESAPTTSSPGSTRPFSAAPCGRFPPAPLEVPLDPHLVRELAGEPAERGAGRVLGRLEMVLGHSHAIGVPNLLGPPSARA